MSLGVVWAKDLPTKAVHATRPRFTAEVSACVENDSSYVLLHVEVPYRELSFRRAACGMEASFDLIVHVLEKDRQIAGDLWPVRLQVSGRGELQGHNARYRQDLAFPLPPGEYCLEVRLSEPGSGQEGALRLGAHLPLRIPGRIALSSLLVGECGLTGSIGELRRDPRIRGEFPEAKDTLCAYAELYHPGLECPAVRLRWRLRDSRGEILSEEEVSFPGGEDVTRMTWSLAVCDRWIDLYQLEVVAGANDQQSSAATSFSLLGESAAALTAFFCQSLEVLAYIATEEEMQELRMSAPDERKAVWDAFWERRDQTPELGYNEYKQEFFRRVHYVNETFGVIRPGWQTDRGRIYIIHGAPTDITRNPLSGQEWPVEIWHYDQLGLSFVFIDRNGYGNYELVRPGW
ncbi:MAG: GWxTD domain-containing protein [Candidatus Eisenbacteria sp.]|nr:GWxTD domain-containing protein [Candidatus Eisenbacteria bacterium]